MSSDKRKKSSKAEAATRLHSFDRNPTPSYSSEPEPCVDDEGDAGLMINQSNTNSAADTQGEWNLSPAAAGMLDVTPVTSSNKDSFDHHEVIHVVDHSRPTRISASASTTSQRDTNEVKLASSNSKSAALRQRRSNDNAFSSSSSSDDEDAFHDSFDDIIHLEGSKRHDDDDGFTSEFDRALNKSSIQQQHHPFNAALPPPPPPKRMVDANNNNQTDDSARSNNLSTASASNNNSNRTSSIHSQEDPLARGVLPDVLMTMRQKIESLTLFDSDMMKLAQDGGPDGPIGGMYSTNNAAFHNTGTFGYGNTGIHSADAMDPMYLETRESLKRSFQQSISAAVLVSLAHKRYERRRLAAMEIEKVVRSLVQKQQEDQLERVRAILLLLSDDYVRSTSEDARKGGVVALAASAIGLKKAPDSSPLAKECRDIILASVVHACNDHSQRVRYYATESLFNVVKIIPSMAVEHFFILFEILRSLYADVELDVKSGAELLDKKLKEVIVGAMNSGQFRADTCIPVFARFVHKRNKATKRLTLTWLQELASEKVIGAPILEFLHLFLGGIFDMVADPTLAIRQSALAFLQSILPKLLLTCGGASGGGIDGNNNKSQHSYYIQEEAIDEGVIGMKVDFDKILQSLVTTMEHPDPFVRKVAMYWMSRIVKAHIGGTQIGDKGPANAKKPLQGDIEQENPVKLSAATLSVRNSLPHVLPGILLSIGDSYPASHPNGNAAIRDSFLPDQTTRALAEQTNACLQNAVRRDGKAYIQHLDSFIVALREELDSPGGLTAKNPPAVERKPYRMDVKHDGTGIESQGWFRASKDVQKEDVGSMMMSRLCALHWIVVLYESVVPDVLKADYASEFIVPIIHQLVDNPPEKIIFKSLEVLAKITIPIKGESLVRRSYASAGSLSGLANLSPSWAATSDFGGDEDPMFPMTDISLSFALDLLTPDRQRFKSRDREVFATLIQLHAHNLHLIGDFSRVIAYMCRLQPQEFVFLSFAVEIDQFVLRQQKRSIESGNSHIFSRVLRFVSSFIQQMSHVLLNASEAKEIRSTLKDCIGNSGDTETDKRRSRLFYILLHSFSHNLVATTSLCLWGGAFRTASLFLRKINPLDVHLMFLLELDRLVEMIERPVFRHLHIQMLDTDEYPLHEGSGTMLFQTLKLLLMIIPQSACFNILRDRLVSVSRFRQSAMPPPPAVLKSTPQGSQAQQQPESEIDPTVLTKETRLFVEHVLSVRELHCSALWETIRAESLESLLPSQSLGESNLPEAPSSEIVESSRSVQDGFGSKEAWLGFTSKEDEQIAKARLREGRRSQAAGVDSDKAPSSTSYNELESLSTPDGFEVKSFLPNEELPEEENWKDYWSTKKAAPSSSGGASGF